jgi:hypothetical protein
MTPADEQEAFDTLDRAEIGSCIYDPHEHRTLLKLLWAYNHGGGEISGFAGALQLPITPSLEDLFGLTHYAFIAAWNRYGWDTLWKMLRTGWDYLYTDEWRIT